MVYFTFGFEYKQCNSYLYDHLVNGKPIKLNYKGMLKTIQVRFNVIFIKEMLILIKINYIKQSELALFFFFPPAGLFCSDERWNQRN